MPAPLNIANQRFGRLVALRRTDKKSGSSVIWVCKCDCGKETETSVSRLRSGMTRSCGCLKDDIFIENITKHGACARGLKHPLYRIWADMLSRCKNTNDTNYGDYGGRGITVYKPWEKYEVFRDYMLSLAGCPDNAQTAGGPRLHAEIDRIRNNEGYKPGNVRWATRKEQLNNTRRNRMVRVNGIYITLANAVEKYGLVPYSVVKGRLNLGWSLKTALKEPIRRRQL